MKTPIQYLHLKTIVLAGSLVVMQGCSESTDVSDGANAQPANAAVPQPVAPLSAATPELAKTPPPPPPVAGGGVPAPTAVSAMAGAGEDPLEIDSEEGFAVQINDVQEAVEAFFDEKEVKPTSIQQVIQAGFLTKLPTLPAGKNYVLNPDTLVVTVK